ncbi:MAG: hypothetical protein GWN00_12770 [Aliifodinibius sp.]|nr:replication endonuclease [Fodinibius sp.]NIV12001.1 hypothetical protein [Fodinibius sp.]NIY25646.1 hypothetical protein [Fodinibius sp.]
MEPRDQSTTRLDNRQLSNQRQEASDGTEGASPWYNPHNGLGYRIDIYENELHVVAPKRQNTDSPPPKRRKGDITRFSKKSRLRVLRKFNQLRTKQLSDPIFISFAAKHRGFSHEKFQECFRRSFLPKLKKIIPNLVYAWRLEPHRDGYPHYHMFAWSWDKDRKLSSQYYKRQIRDAFSESIGDFSLPARRYGIDIEKIHNKRKAFSYISKYLAKEDDPTGSEIEGRRWATSTNFPAVPITSFTLSRNQYAEFEKIAKKLLRAKGGRYKKLAEQMEDFNDVFIWLDLDEIIWLLKSCPGVYIDHKLEFYHRSGQLVPDDQFFEEYSAYM